MTENARAARNAYKRNWTKNNRSKVRAYQEKYWEKRAAAQLARKAAGEEEKPEEA